ncbi:LytTr DNA-binding domain-containing protein [Neolewinella xylanilytica]|uniref:LytTr DNA-binding domain-containing protein n=1 Tax=Neolewinella xylanilytica TaxID=1514080 RepID=A0A2S6IBD7_9BACT|nr:LytTR family transcriptional regulator DNA-binding domain-containing protein [Neolewinella xylanilytica]PPK88821.1 LytTr DNA-binding domain-containing protein [Neolewinella xylanilytica]
MLNRNPFSRPFPERLFGRQVIIGHGRTALFVFVALLFIFPLARALAYGLIVFAVALAYHFITERLGVRRTGPKWTMAKWTLDQALLLLFVSAACFLLYNYTVGWSVMNLEVFLYIAVPTVLVGLLPIVTSGLALQIRAERENQKVASRLQLSLIGSTGGVAPVSAGKPSGEGSPDSIVVGYQPRLVKRTTIYFESGRRKEIEQSLDIIEKEYAYDGLLRCHPHYSVNPDHILGVTADAQGLRLTVQGTSVKVPVTADNFSKF